MTKKDAKLKIPKLLRELIADAAANTVTFEKFKAVSEELASLYQQVLPASSYKGFTLSSSMQLIWLNPDQYLSKDTYMSKWMGSVLGKRPEELDEENVHVVIYQALKKLLGVSTFEGMSLVDRSNKLEKIDAAEATTPVRSNGEITYLKIANTTRFMQEILIAMQQQLGSKEDIEVIRGDRDIWTYATSRSFAPCTSRFTPSHRDLVAQIWRQAASCMEVLQVLPSSTERTLPPPVNPPPTLQTANAIMVKKCLYRDKNGEIHEFNFENNPETLTSLFDRIQRIETPEGGAEPETDYAGGDFDPVHEPAPAAEPVGVAGAR